MRRLAVAWLVLGLAVAAAACGGGGGDQDGADERARELYGDYRAAQDERGDVEQELRQAFVDIADAARSRDRAGVRMAARRGEQAAAEIDRLLAREIEAATALGEDERLAQPAARLERGLTTSRRALGLVVRELAIARADPLLEQRRNERAIRRLARRSADVSQRGEIERRKADLALAAALGVDAPVDPIFGSK